MHVPYLPAILEDAELRPGQVRFVRHCIPIHWLFVLLGGFDTSGHADDRFLCFHADDYLLLLGATNPAAVHHTACLVRITRTPKQGLFMDRFYDRQHCGRDSLRYCRWYHHVCMLLLPRRWCQSIQRASRSCSAVQHTTPYLHLYIRKHDHRGATKRRDRCWISFPTHAHEHLVQRCIAAAYPASRFLDLHVPRIVSHFSILTLSPLFVLTFLDHSHTGLAA
jgi:hypothetical protein